MKKNNKNISLIFSTPIWASLVPNYKELNKKMYKYIKKIELKPYFLILAVLLTQKFRMTNCLNCTLKKNFLKFTPSRKLTAFSHFGMSGIK